MGDYEDTDDEYSDEATDVGDLESRVAGLEDTVQSSGYGASAGTGCGTAVYSLGGTLAVVISWQENHAVLWAVLHGFLSWLYVIYAVVVHSDRVQLL
jgi:hypothetical protein